MQTLSHLNQPSRISLARIPTPVMPLQRMGARLGVDLYLKRDDLTGAALSGNKIRKLEYVLADALEQGADTVITCGGAQSNHCRATAVAAAMMGLRCKLILRTADPASPPPVAGNILLDRMAGAEIRWITPEMYQQRDAVFAEEMDALKRAGRRPYAIPEGASNALGAWGYIRAAAELAADLAALGEEAIPTTVITATGSGGTCAGLVMGARLLDLKARIVCVNVCDDAAYFRRVIGEICDTAIKTYGLPVAIDRERDIEIVDGYVGRGYALSRPEELELIRDVARQEGIFLDPVYTGKAFFGMTRELARNPECFGKRIIFLHTGGLFGLFPKAEEMALLLGD